MKVLKQNFNKIIAVHVCRLHLFKTKTKENNNHKTKKDIKISLSIQYLVLDAFGCVCAGNNL